MVGCRRLPAAVASPAVMAVRRRRIRVRTRVRLARFTSARSRDCAARFKTDFFFFLTLVACPWAIYCSLCVALKLLTLNDAHAFVKRAQRSVVDEFPIMRAGSMGRVRGREVHGVRPVAAPRCHVAIDLIAKFREKMERRGLRCASAPNATKIS